MRTFGKTCLGTCRINCLVNNYGVTESINVSVNVGVVTSTSMSGVTLLGTSRSSNYCIIAVLVTKSGDNAIFCSIAIIALAVLSTIFILASGSIFNPFAPYVILERKWNCFSGELISTS